MYYEKDVNGLYYVHLDLKVFSPSRYKEMLVVMQEVLIAFNEKGVEELHVLIPADDPKLLKFEEHMGFVEIYRNLEHNFILLGQLTSWD